MPRAHHPSQDHDIDTQHPPVSICMEAGPKPSLPNLHITKRLNKPTKSHPPSSQHRKDQQRNPSFWLSPQTRHWTAPPNRRGNSPSPNDRPPKLPLTMTHPPLADPSPRPSKRCQTWGLRTPSPGAVPLAPASENSTGQHEPHIKSGRRQQPLAA
jgi:hypothetical protein